MTDLQKVGGVAALIQAAAYVVGLGLALTLLAPVLDADADEYVTFLVDNQPLIHAWHLIIYVVAGVCLVPLALALHERLTSDSPALGQIATAFGLIWAGLVLASGMLLLHDAGVVARLYGEDPAGATTVWLALSAVEDGLGGAIELPGGLWVLLVSWAAFQTDGLPKPLNALGVAIGLAGILTLVPALAELATVFGLGMVIWFVGVGIVLLTESQPHESLEKPDTLTPQQG